jgi:hypothetical protein
LEVTDGHVDSSLFADLPDPRRAQGTQHRLSDMIVIAVTALTCCADNWSDVADFDALRHSLERDHGRVETRPRG